MNDADPSIAIAWPLAARLTFRRVSGTRLRPQIALAPARRHATMAPMSTSPAIVLSNRAHARIWLRSGFALLVAAVVALVVGGDVVAIVCFSLAVTPLIVGLVLAGVASRYERSAAALLAGECELRWDLPEAQWRAHVVGERGRAKSLVLLLAGIGALAGVGVALAMAEDGVRLAGSSALVWVVTLLAGALCGSGVGLVIRAFQRAAFDRMARSQGVFCLGAGGMYLTGSYWPWDGIGVSVRDVAREGDVLVFQFRITEGGMQAVRVPIAPGHEEAAQRYVDRVHGR